MPKPPSLILLLASMLAMLSLGGCGSGDSNDSFASCGNGHLDAGEQCDDGNLLDTDDCLSTCVLSTCGDSFLDSKGSRHEDCDGLVLGGATCASLGLASGVLRCAAACRFDTSECGAAFTPTPVPTLTFTTVPTATATATQTPVPGCGDGVLESGETCDSCPADCPDRPTATATATLTPATGCGNGLLDGDETCATCPADCAVQPCNAVTPLREVEVQFTVPSSLPSGVTGVTLLVAYHSELVSLPGSGSAGSVSGRIKNKPSNAIAAANDLDYAVREVLSRASPIPAGRLFTIEFDSCAGAAPPTAAEFGCTIEGCVNTFGDVDGCGCQVTVP